VSMEQPQRSPNQDDEISLIDIAKILVYRRWWFVVTFVVVVLASGLWVLLQSGKTPIQESYYQYTTQLAVGYKTSSDLIEPLPSIIEQLNGAIIPRVKQQNDFFNSLSAQAGYVSNSNIVTITTQGEKKSDIAEFHESLVEPIIERHERHQKNLVQQRNPIFENSQRFQVIPSEIVALAVEKKVALGGERSVSDKMILVLGVVLGIVAGMMAAFFAEFVARVRESLKE